jgi:hypothetical protein
MDGDKKPKEVGSVAHEYVLKRLANAFGYRNSADVTKFRDFWRAEDHKKCIENFLTNENIE